VLYDRVSQSGVIYPVLGALLAAGAPLGLLFMRQFLDRTRAGLREDIRRDLPTYAYLAASTTIVFVVLGRTLGKHVDHLARLSDTDGLTGLLNARAFRARLRGEIERSRRSGAPMTLLLMDLDRLKMLNDRFGHAFGDRALETIAHAIQREMRSIDSGGRLGGDEFGLLAVGTDRGASAIIAERLRGTLANGVDEQLEVQTTVSMGVVTFDPSRDQLADDAALVRAADTALYSAKHSGRNRVAFGSLQPRIAHDTRR
jgi:diguanylate cyclase (GGDEF)-like protein